MKITKELLKEKRACKDGKKAFNRFFPDGFDVSLWTAEFQLRIIKKTRLRKYIGWAHQSGLIPLWDLRWSNLSWSNLRESDLRWSNLRWSDLRGSNLSWSKLRGSDLRWSNLSWSNLSWSDLSWSDLSGSNLSWSNLSGSNLSGSDLSGSNLSGSDLSGSNLSGAIYSKYTILPTNFDPKSAGMLWIEV